MRKVVYLVAASLDGQIARADGSFDCFPNEGDHIAEYLKALDSFDAVLMGRKTYEVGLRAGLTDPYPKMKSYVLSSTMKESPNPRVQIVPGDPAPFVERLKTEPGRDIYLCGGAELAARLLAANLIDEIAIKLNPLLIGAGMPLFASVEKPLLLELTGSKVFRSGVVWLTYRPTK